MPATISLFGSGEFLPWSTEVDRHTLAMARNGDGSVVVIPAASAPEGRDVFDDWARKGLAHYEGMGVEARVCGLRDRADAFSDDVIAQLDGASMLYFSGGNPAYLADTLRGSPFWDAVLAALEGGAAISGCSAGACFLGEVAPNSDEESLEPARWASSGLRLLPGLVFGPHWNMLETWMPGIHAFIKSNLPEDGRLVTLDEHTAMVGDGAEWRVFGDGEVAVYAGSELIAGPFRAGDTLAL